MTYTTRGSVTTCDACKVVLTNGWRGMSDHSANHHLLDIQAARQARRDQQKEAS